VQVTVSPSVATSPAPATKPTTALPVVSVTGPLSAANGQPAFLSTTEGWICATPLRYTTNGGVTWQTIGVGTTTIIYNEPCAFERGGHAWIAMHGSPGAPTIVRVVAGPHPQVDRALLPGAASNESVSSVAFADVLDGWATAIIAYNTPNPRSDLYRTIDGGMHWQRIVRNAPVLAGLRFTSPTTGWGVAGRRMERTDDGGRTWRNVPIVPTPYLRDDAKGELLSVFAFGPRLVVDGMAPGGNFGQLYIEVSNDDGAHWSLDTISRDIIQPPGTAPWEFIAADATHWRLSGGTALTNTDDAGKTWHTRSTPLSVAEITGVTFITRDIGWIVGCDNTCYTAALTTDAGRSWRLLNKS